MRACVIVSTCRIKRQCLPCLCNVPYISGLIISLSSRFNKIITHTQTRPLPHLQRVLSHQQLSSFSDSVRTVGSREHLHDDLGTTIQPPEYAIGVDSDSPGYDSCRVFPTSRLYDSILEQGAVYINSRGQPDDWQPSLSSTATRYRTIRARKGNRRQYMSNRR